ncbi:hypothetical protein EN813_019595 [Mesorhizobium sp. M00.F.Ca.ET.170.01.1.1]|nr:hypothetical protein EN813_019595 [Mesorhizobium sp. M00.F.Ca.ET.170.01.1.1]
MALILLSCSPDMQSCHRAETRPAIYGGMNQCAAALLARLEGTNMIGRCRTVKGLASGQGVAVVRVTRGNGSHATSTDYLVTRTESATE